MIRRQPLPKPDYRNNGKYQFIVGYGGGMQTVHTVHFTFEELSERLTNKYGSGTLIDDGENLWWEPSDNADVNKK